MERFLKEKRAALTVVGLLGLALAVLALSGGREATAALSGVVRSPIDVAHGLAYVGVWLCVILVAPIIVLAAGADWLLRGRSVRKRALTAINLDEPKSLCEITHDVRTSFQMDGLDSGAASSGDAQLRRE